ncbi:MAG: DUF2254 domain-containing protein [Acidobacteria bacterium]|nr:DUF2254 domain-containing protein [Acidobacteriota bacterium]
MQNTGSSAIRLSVLWHWLRSSFWFVPSVMLVAAGVLSYITIEVDRLDLKDDHFTAWWLYSGSIDGAREILSTISSSMITVAGVVFSITIVVLSLASSQFGPRLIWNFMHDIGNQVVLGMFVSTYIYCLLILGTIDSNVENQFIPHISITVGILLGLTSLGVLIYFIHHISSSIHANSVAAAVWRDLEMTIHKHLPQNATRSRQSAADLDEDFSAGVCPVPAHKSGYLEATNLEGLLKIAIERNLVLKIEYRAGHFIVKGNCLLLAKPAERVDAFLADEMNRAFIIGPQRTPEQDIEFSIHQLVEIAVRALSPGVNDPFTAMTCIDWLGAALCDFLTRENTSRCLFDAGGRLRVIVPQFTFPRLMDAAFNNIRQHARTDASVTIRLLESLAAIAGRVRKAEDIASVTRHAHMVKRGSDEGLYEQNDRKDVETRFRRVMEAIESKRVP